MSTLDERASPRFTGVPSSCVAAGSRPHQRRVPATNADGRISLISFTDEGHRCTAEVARTFAEAVQRYFVDPLDDEDIAAIVRVWGKLEAAGG